MVDFHDRRDSVGAGDFNNPKGNFSLTSPGDDEYKRWDGMSHAEARPEVSSYFSGQKNTQTWGEANRLAKRRADHQVRSGSYGAKENTQPWTGSDYADAYQGHLAAVMATKGKSIAESRGELHHRQSGYGRT